MPSTNAHDVDLHVSHTQLYPRKPPTAVHLDTAWDELFRELPTPFHLDTGWDVLFGELPVDGRGSAPHHLLTCRCALQPMPRMEKVTHREWLP